jgi:hypothetical protein
MRSSLASLLALSLTVMGCDASPPPGEAASPDAWENVAPGDTPAVAGAKRACRREPRREEIGPTPGGTDPFMRCMKAQANAAFGTPAFEEICAAIPGARADRAARACVTFDL